MNKGILLAILSTIIVAGCVGGELPFPWIQAPTAYLGANGLVITEFSIDNTEVYSNKSAKITMTVANKGGASVPDGSALAVLQGSAIMEDLVTPGNLYWTGRSTTDSIYLEMDKDMNPYDPVRDVPADEKILNWYLTSPIGIDIGTSRNDVFIGRLYYDYSTTATGNVWVYSETEASAAQAAGRGLNQNSFSSTSGPIALYVTVKPTNVIVSTGDNEFTMQIKVSNVGGGTAYCQGCVDYTTPDLEILADSELNIVDVAVTDVPGWTGEDACSDSAVELVKGEAVLTCDVTVSVPDTFRSDQVKVTADYGYWVERTASITVSGK